MAINVVTFPTPTASTLVGAVAAVMSEVQTVAKRGLNKFHNYKYVAMGDLLQAITPLLGKHGLVVFQSETGRAMFDNDNVIAIEYSFVVAHSSGEKWEPLRQTGVSTCRNSKGGWDDKALNKCHTAARKYFLLSLFQIPTGDEADADLGENDRFANVSGLAAKKTVHDVVDHSPVKEEVVAQPLTDGCEIETRRAAAQLKSKLPQYVVEPPQRKLQRALAKSRDTGPNYEAIIRAEQRKPTKFRQPLQTVQPLDSFDERNPPPSNDDGIPDFLDRRGQ